MPTRGFEIALTSDQSIFYIDGSGRNEVASDIGQPVGHDALGFGIDAEGGKVNIDWGAGADNPGIGKHKLRFFNGSKDAFQAR
jgi:hypothetical protein